MHNIKPHGSLYVAENIASRRNIYPIEFPAVFRSRDAFGYHIELDFREGRRTRPQIASVGSELPHECFVDLERVDRYVCNSDMAL